MYRSKLRILSGSRLSTSLPTEHDNQQRYLGTTSVQPNHYEVLGLKRTASKRDIKHAFVSLTKMHHPDMKLDQTTVENEDFIRVVEAYKVLSNTDMKKEYDYNLLRRDNPNLPPPGHVLAQFYKDGTIYTGPPDTGQPRRFTNTQVVIAAIIFSFVGSFIQYLLVKRQSNKRAARADEIHLDALAQIEKVKSLTALGQTQLQMQVADYKNAKHSALRGKKTNLVSSSEV